MQQFLFVMYSYEKDIYRNIILTLIVSMYALAYFWQSSTLSL